MLRVPDDDLEQQMEVIRYFVRSYTLRVAACELTDVLPLMQVSDYLTWIAEVVIEHTVNISLAASQPISMVSLQESEFASRRALLLWPTERWVVLSWVISPISIWFFITVDTARLDSTRGPRSIDNSTFFARLGQRIIHLLSTSPPSGAAYEIDMRLRPSGNSGMLVSSLTAFEKYQRESAWTWEHQALVRARVVAGEKILAATSIECARAGS